MTKVVSILDERVLRGPLREFIAFAARQDSEPGRKHEPPQVPAPLLAAIRRLAELETSLVGFDVGLDDLTAEECAALRMLRQERARFARMHQLCPHCDRVIPVEHVICRLCGKSVKPGKPNG